MPIVFQSLLKEAAFDLGAVRFLRHQPGEAIDPLREWKLNREAFEDYQSVQLISRRSYFNAPYWAAFAATTRAETMFLGMYAASLKGPIQPGEKYLANGKVLDERRLERYETQSLSELSEYAGHLLIDWGASNRAWVQRADSHSKRVSGLFEVYKEDPYPGHLNLIEPLSRVLSFPASWVEILTNTRGIYLLTCPSTLEQYVGKADGVGGFWGRWLIYATNGHGGNIELKSRDPSDYQVSILEVAGSTADDRAILAMESRWKAKLKSREMGLNRN